MISFEFKFFDKRSRRKITHCKTPNLNTNRVVSNRSDYNIIRMHGNIGIILTVHHHKFRPFF